MEVVLSAKLAERRWRGARLLIEREQDREREKRVGKSIRGVDGVTSPVPSQASAHLPVDSCAVHGRFRGAPCYVNGSGASPSFPFYSPACRGRVALFVDCGCCDRVEIGLKSRFDGKTTRLILFTKFPGKFHGKLRKREASNFITLNYYRLPSWCSLEQSGTY